MCPYISIETTGSSGHFDKDESLALTFASKAARRGLPSAEFAMGYYAEVGVGRPKDLIEARAWYEKVFFSSPFSPFSHHFLPY